MPGQTPPREPDKLSGTSAPSSISCAGRKCAPLLYPPSLNRFRAAQCQLYLALRRLLRLLNEDPDNYNAAPEGRDIQGPQDSASPFQPHFPQATCDMLQVGLANALQTLLLD